MFPDWRRSIRWLIVCCMDLLLFWAFVVGAKMSISRWMRSHQKGDVFSMLSLDSVYAVVRHRRIVACSVWNLALFRGRWRMCFLHVFLKSGGLCL